MNRASHMFKIVVAVLITSQTALAQVVDKDFCRPVLDIGARQESYTRLAWQTAQQLYDNACSKEDVKKDVNASAGFLASLIGVAKAVVKLDFGSSDAQIKEFCRTYQSQYSASLAAEQSVKSVNERALDNWLKCREIDRQRVAIRPNVLRATLSFDVQRTGGAQLTVTGVHFDPKLLTCEAPDLAASVKQRRWRKIGPDWGGLVLTDDQEIQIKCTRTGFAYAGTVVRPEAEIAVLTSAGTLPITLPRDVTRTYAERTQLARSSDFCGLF